MNLFKLVIITIIYQFTSSLTYAAEVPPTSVEWPTGAEALIDKTIEIKITAQRQHERMFSEGGVYGNSFALNLSKLAEILTKHPKLRDQLIEIEGVDLKAKIALWALDLNARPEEYAKMEHLYMSDNPIGKTALECEAKRKAADEIKDPHENGMNEGIMPDSHLLRRPRPKVSGPPAVLTEHKVDINRWILEYLYFSPPTGQREYEISSTRFNLICALKDIGNEKSLIMLKFDNELQIESFPNNIRTKGGGADIGYHVKEILDFRTQRAFSIAASMMYDPVVRSDVRRLISYLSRMDAEDKHNPWYPKLNEFRKLANFEWQTDAEKELASWLKTLPSFP